ncbi:segregation and condensation protein A [Psychrosphaera haliotis]|uniref:Segregation and condensation protein A n=1 Tax=Psychrosphaera haliotis TaxID=555083 RepID=A0A6N8F6B2_9GAMM|nr:ScpA family protein [Psychrosphaera haliotis]MUH71728.1 segregation/condensation protein A [Psychrosphaera haliotis]
MVNVNDTTNMIQQDLPLALVRGEIVIERPQDLFIPPDALEVFLDAFEGPLDFLLYLIKKQKFDIVDLPIFEITKQYMKYVDVMRSLKLELAAEYLVMAALLAEIKSRLLLPKHDLLEDEEHDPRAELIKRLQQYEVIKKAAENLDELPRLGREAFIVAIEAPVTDAIAANRPEIDLKELVIAFQDILKRASAFKHHEISKETLSTRERMTQILHKLRESNKFVPFENLFLVSEGKAGVVVTFLAILELVKESMLDVVQASAFGVLHVKYKGAEIE